MDDARASVAKADRAGGSREVPIRDAHRCQRLDRPREIFGEPALDRDLQTGCRRPAGRDGIARGGGIDRLVDVSEGQ
jgi:hypothetical protein